jgi:hypothetical protein
VLSPDTDPTVCDVKRMARASDTCLIYASAVREDTMRLSDLGIADGSVVLLLSSGIEDMREERGALQDSGAALELASMFASGHAPPSSAQSKFDGGRLRRFLQHKAPTWHQPDSGDSAALQRPAFWAPSRSD